MPVKRVLYWQANAGTSVSSQIINEISQAIESINGFKYGRWKSNLSYYRPSLRDQTQKDEYPREFAGVTLMEQPNKYYFVLRWQKIVVEAEHTIQAIMEKLQSYKLRGSLSYEGIHYRLGDFQLRVAKVVPAQTDLIRGIVMEVEYLPISSLEKSRQIMEEFLDIWQGILSKRSLTGHFVHTEPNFADYGLSDSYTSQHTAIQYANIMAHMITTIPNARN